MSRIKVAFAKAQERRGGRVNAIARSPYGAPAPRVGWHFRGVVAREACAGAHGWVRYIQAQGHAAEFWGQVARGPAPLHIRLSVFL
jgi:hypothetical protein